MHFPRLVSQVHMKAGKNKRKEKVPYMSDPNQNVKKKKKQLQAQSKDLFIKRAQKN